MRSAPYVSFQTILVNDNDIGWNEYLQLKRDFHYLLYNMFNCSLHEVMMTKQSADSTSELLPTGIPNPKTAHASWLMAMFKHDKPVSLVDYQQGKTDSNTAIDMIEAARRITMGNRDEVIEPVMMLVSGEQINHYQFREPAKAFWANGVEANMSDEEILNAWRAMQTIADEVKTDDEQES